MLNARCRNSQQSFDAYGFLMREIIISKNRMRFEVPFRIIIKDPIADVAMMIQKGRHELVAPTSRTDAEISFDISIRGVLENGSPNFLGPFAQGPKDARFVYVNSGTSAGEAHSCWSRRAKLSLMSITKEQIAELLSDQTRALTTAIQGRGRDGGPVCASVKGLAWEIRKR